MWVISTFTPTTQGFLKNRIDNKTYFSFTHFARADAIHTGIQDLLYFLIQKKSLIALIDIEILVIEIAQFGKV